MLLSGRGSADPSSSGAFSLRRARIRSAHPGRVDRARRLRQEAGGPPPRPVRRARLRRAPRSARPGALRGGCRPRAPGPQLVEPRQRRPGIACPEVWAARRSFRLLQKAAGVGPGGSVAATGGGDGGAEVSFAGIGRAGALTAPAASLRAGTGLSVGDGATGPACGRASGWEERGPARPPRGARDPALRHARAAGRGLRSRAGPGRPARPSCPRRARRRPAAPISAPAATSFAPTLRHAGRRGRVRGPRARAPPPSCLAVVEPGWRRQRRGRGLDRRPWADRRGRRRRGRGPAGRDSLIGRFFGATSAASTSRRAARSREYTVLTLIPSAAAASGALICSISTSRNTARRSSVSAPRMRSSSHRPLRATRLDRARRLVANTGHRGARGPPCAAPGAGGAARDTHARCRQAQVLSDALLEVREAGGPTTNTSWTASSMLASGTPSRRRLRHTKSTSCS